MLIIIKLIEHVYIKYFFTTLILFQYNKPFHKDYRHFMEPGRQDLIETLQSEAQVQQTASCQLFFLRKLDKTRTLPWVIFQNSNALIKWSLIPAETGVWLAVETAMPVVNYFEKPVTAIDSIFCHGLDVIEANLPIVKYPPDLVRDSS